MGEKNKKERKLDRQTFEFLCVCVCITVVSFDDPLLRNTANDDHC